jgi:Co/Zn/Cd efflux system component
MHTDNLSQWSHDHIFDRGSHAAERGTRLVMWITAATMVVEIFAGWWFNSMALLADGWHMSSHAVAIGVSAMPATRASPSAPGRSRYWAASPVPSSCSASPR